MTLQEAKRTSTGSTLTRSPADRAEVLIGREKELRNQLKKAIENLKGLMVKVKTDGVKENFERIVDCYNKLSRSKADLQTEFRTRMHVTD